jgi:hypothetical protein
MQEKGCGWKEALENSALVGKCTVTGVRYNTKKLGLPESDPFDLSLSKHDVIVFR